MRHAAADVLIKNMMGNTVDIDLTVELDPNAASEVIDGRIRTAIGVALDSARGRITQSEIIRQIKSIGGVNNIQIPLAKFAKGNGSYNVGVVIPTGTHWTKITEDELFSDKPNLTFPLNSYITQEVVLQDQTMPSGGYADSFVGLLYEGESYTRCLTFDAFRQAGPGSFYITGADDFFLHGNLITTFESGRILISMKEDMKQTLPSYLAFRVTYQVWEEGGARDITLSPTEYLKAGRITISYVSN